MSHQSKTSLMAIDIDKRPLSNSTDYLVEFPDLRRISTLARYKGSMEGGLNRNLFIRYLVVLYSHDSYLNKNPHMEIEERMRIAADFAGFERDEAGNFDPDVDYCLFDLQDERIIQIIFDFLLYQNKHVWTEIVTVEHEIQEFQRKRMTPVVGDKDKDILSALNIKNALLEGTSKRVKYLKELYTEFYGEHQHVKKAVEQQRDTLFNRVAKS